MELINKKLDELIALAELESDVNAQIILHCLRGARAAGEDGNLAALVQQYIITSLMPKAMQAIHDNKAVKN